jgi:malate/lactate dehydrogenase
MKLGVIGGAGLLGATTAFYAAIHGLVDEIVLYDIRENLAVSHAMDIDIGVAEFSGTRAVSGRLDDLSGCDILFNTAGIPERQVASRAEFLEGNLTIYRDLAAKIRAWGTEPILISASNPIDVLNAVLCEEIGCAPEKLIGFSRNDTLRFQWSIAKESGLKASEIDCLVIGEHGEGQVPLFSAIRHRGNGAVIDLTAAQRTNVLARIQNWFTEYQKLDCGRSSGWTSGVSMGQILRMITTDSEEIVSCSVIPHGEYGLQGLSIGLPVQLGPSGVKKIVELPLSDAEQDGLQAAAKKIGEMVYRAKMAETRLK